MDIYLLALIFVASICVFSIVKLVFLVDHDKRTSAAKNVSYGSILKGTISPKDGRGLSEPETIQGMRWNKKTKKLVPNATWSSEYQKSLSK